MLAQTNLQLYRQMITAGWAGDSLARARATYDLARSLFGDAYRPSHKPFVCHLVGTASAALHWGAAEPVVLAGLVHSAHLFGDFGDGERKTTPRRRRFVAEVVGHDVEELVYRYEQASFRDDPTVRVLRLADLLDELTDAGPLVARGKEIGGYATDPVARRACLADAEELIGSIAVGMFREAFALLDQTEMPSSLTTTDPAFHRVTLATLPISRGSVGRRWARLKQSITRKWAA